MNNALLTKVAEQLKIHGNNQSFSMGTWISLDTHEIIDRINNHSIELLSEGLSTDEYRKGIDLSRVLEHEDEVDIDCSLDNIIVKPFVMIKEGICKTAGCVAGWVILVDNDFIFNDDFLEAYTQENFFEQALDLLDISNDEAHNLFYCGQGSVWQLIAHEYGFGYDTWHGDLTERIYQHQEWTAYLYSKITANMVSEVLIRIADGELFLSNGYKSEACFDYQVEDMNDYDDNDYDSDDSEVEV